VKNLPLLRFMFEWRRRPRRPPRTDRQSSCSAEGGHSLYVPPLLIDADAKTVNVVRRRSIHPISSTLRRRGNSCTGHLNYMADPSGQAQLADGPQQIMGRPSANPDDRAHQRRVIVDSSLSYKSGNGPSAAHGRAVLHDDVNRPGGSARSMFSANSRAILRGRLCTRLSPAARSAARPHGSDNGAVDDNETPMRRKPRD